MTPLVKSLVITPRFPWPAYTGERLRATIWLTALARDGEVTLISPRGQIPSAAPPLHFFPVTPTLKRFAAGIVEVLGKLMPFQCLMTAPYDWDAAIVRARQEAGPFDVTVVVLSRLHPWLRGSLAGRTVLDAVDSLRRSAVERARAATPGARWLWQMEGRRMGALELDASQAYGRVVVISDEESFDLGGAVAVPNGVSTAPLGDAARRFDFGFWGRLPYFANADACRWLLDEIWPAIRALHPTATLVIGGAAASKALRAAARRAGVTLLSPIENVGQFARSIRVALMPLRYGTGQSTKVLEAAEAGCALVGTPQAFRGLAPLLPHARVASDPLGLARAAVEVLRDETGRRLLVAGLREVVESQYNRAATLDRFSAIARMELPA